MKIIKEGPALDRTFIDRRGTDSEKWDRYGPDVLPLWVADMDFPSAESIVRALRDRLEHRVFGYTNEIRGLRESILEWLETRHRWKVKAEDIVPLPGVVTGFNLAARAFGQRGVLVQPPVYPPFLSVGKNAGVPLVENPLLPPTAGDPLYRVDIQHFKACLKRQPSLFLLCNPHNPVGRVFTKEELWGMAEACLRGGALICSDEIHADLTFPGHIHLPIASLDPEIGRNTITLMAPSKTFNIPSLEFAFAVIPNPDLRKEFQDARRGLVGEVNLFGMVAARAAYREGAPWLEETLQYLEANRKVVEQAARERLRGTRLTSPQGTYLAWIDCRELAQQYPEPFRNGTANFFLTHGRVALNEGTSFGAGGDGHVRLNFACHRDTLTQALDRMAQAIEQLDSRVRKGSPKVG